MSEQQKYDHKQVEVEYDNDIVTVDEGIVELLTMVWKEGNETFNSCQNNFGNIYGSNLICTRFMNWSRKLGITKLIQ